MMKRIITLLLITCLGIFSMAGCSSNTGGETTKGDTGQTNETQEADTADIENRNRELPKEGLICFSNTSLSYYFFVAEQEAARRAVEAAGYDFEASAAEFESVTENNNLNNFIAKEPIAIIADPADTDGIVAPLKKAQDAGIPVAVIDATIAAGGQAGVTITFDNYGAGYSAAEKIVELLTAKYGSPKGRVLNAYGIQNNEAIRNRREGFVDCIKQYPDIELIETPGEGNVDTTMNAALNALADYGSFDAMHAPSDSPCMGLYEALSKTGNLYKVGEEGHVILVTIDGEPIAIERIKEGYYDASVDQDAVAYSEIAVEMLITYLLIGEEVPVGTEYVNKEYIWEKTDIIDGKNGPTLVVPHTIITKENVDDERLWGNVAKKELGVEY